MVSYLLQTSRKSKEKGRAGWRTLNTLNFEKVIQSPPCPHPYPENFKIKKKKKSPKHQTKYKEVLTVF